MEVIRQSSIIDKVDLFNMTEGTAGNIIDLAGEVLELDKWVYYRDTDKDGKDKEILTIIEKNGNVVGTISQTFIRQFLKMVDFLDGEDFNIRVVTGTSKNGREYVTCQAER